jgi:predicted RNA methylase
MLGQDTEFYPSTPETARKVCDLIMTHFKWRLEGKRILDPSAGSGALLDAIASWKSRKKSTNFYAVEIDQELRYVLQGKDYLVLDSDWLQYSEPTSFDAIAMNPPFSDGIRHILKSWDYLAAGGILCSVVPKTMTSGGNAAKELLSRLVEQHGHKVDIGCAFANSYRSTQVDCEILVLTKPADLKPAWMDDLKFEVDSSSTEEFTDNPLVCSNQIEALVRQYEVIRAALIQRHRAQLEIDYYIGGIERPIYDSIERDVNEGLSIKDDFDTQLKVLKSRFWQTLFTRTKLGQGTTTAFKAQFAEGSLKIGIMAFNKANIYEVLTMFFCNRDQIMQEAVEAVFKRCTDYHKDNSIHQEGWKNNRTSKVAKKVIIPSQSLVSKYSSYESWNTVYAHDRLGQFLDDFDKVLSYLTGLSTSREGFKWARETINQFLRDCGNDYQQEFQSTFFKLRVFKKGTVHIIFRDSRIGSDFL